LRERLCPGDPGDGGQARGRRQRSGERMTTAPVIELPGLVRTYPGPPPALAGGECQRVALARGLVTRPSLLLCDEPTGNLDSRNAATLMELLDRLNSTGFSILVITHDAAVAAHAGRTIAI